MPSPNPIKYTAGATAADTIKKGNFVLGVTNKDYSPTSSTEFWSGITPPTTSGYTVYEYKSSNGPSIRCANDDAGLIDIANDYGCTGSTIVDSLAWFATGPNFLVTNITDYPAIVTNGLVTLIDAGSTVSYPRGKNTIYDAVNNVNNGTLINGTAFSATGGTGGSIYFDGIDDYVDIGAVTYSASFSVDVWLYTLPSTFKSYNTLFGSFSNQLSVNTGGSKRFDANFALSSDIFSTGGTTDNAWYNVVFTYNASTQAAIFYINGVYDSTQTVAGLGYSGSKFLGMRYPGDGQAMKGYIPVVKVYNRPITAAEVTQNYNAYKIRYI